MQDIGSGDNWGARPWWSREAFAAVLIGAVLLPAAVGAQGAIGTSAAETKPDAHAPAVPASGKDAAKVEEQEAAIQEKPAHVAGKVQASKDAGPAEPNAAKVHEAPVSAAGPPSAGAFLAGLSQTAAQLRDSGVKGDLTYKSFAFVNPTENDPQQFANEGIMHLQWDRELTDWARFSIKGEARQDDRRFTRGVRTRVPDNLLHRRMVDLMESYLKLALPGEAQLTVGKLTHTWGKAEFYSPTDNINPYDYLDVIDRQKIPVYSGELSKTLELPSGPVDVSFVYIPFFTPARNSLLNSRWTSSTAATAGVGDTVPEGASVAQRVTPGREVQNMQYAVRARQTIGKVDVSVSYFDGFEYLPIVRKDTSGSSTTFVPVYRHMQVPGVDIETTVDQFVIKGEVAFKLADREAKDSRFQGLIGARYTRDDILTNWFKRLALSYEYNRQAFISAKNPRYITDGSFLNGFQNSGSGGLEFEFNPDRTLNREMKFRVASSMDYSTSANYWVQYQLTVKPIEDYTVETGVDTFSGGRSTFWGQWRDNDRFYFKLTRLF